MNKEQLITAIDAILPQTQCTRCGYPSCRDYALAISEEKAEINQCPPGGDKGIKELASLLNKPPLPLNPLHGSIKPQEVALIDESVCIGCTLCIKACPVDAIVGANKMLHTVIESECTGCDLCLAVCPVDCITMAADPVPLWNKVRQEKARGRFVMHMYRRNKEQAARTRRLEQQAQLLKKVSPTSSSDFMEEILARARQKIKDG